MAGKLIIFSAPSGSGKSTIINHLLKQNLNLHFSISATSRAPRGLSLIHIYFDQNLTFRAATGIYYQSPFYKELRTTVQDAAGNDIIELNKDIKSQRSIHFILGGDYTFRAADRNFKVSADLYYKKLDDLIPYTVDNVKIRYYGAVSYTHLQVDGIRQPS